MLEARQLTLEIAGRCLVRELNLSLDEGETWAVLGANGSGKTTLLLTLAGLRRASSGHARLRNLDLDAWSARERARTIGVLFQDSDSAFPATALDIVLTGRHPHHGRFEVSDADDIAHAQAALREVGLEGFGPRWVTTLSGGERRRIELAAVLAQEAPILLLDEPTNHLDFRQQTLLLERLVARALLPGRLNVFVLHDVNLASRFCTHCLMLFGDGDYLCGPLSQVLTRMSLERLYGCPIREINDGLTGYFFPG